MPEQQNRITVHYRDVHGAVLHEDLSLFAPVGEPYQINAPVFQGYLLISTSTPLANTMTNAENAEATLIYQHLGRLIIYGLENDPLAIELEAQPTDAWKVAPVKLPPLPDGKQYFDVSDGFVEIMHPDAYVPQSPINQIMIQALNQAELRQVTDSATGSSANVQSVQAKPITVSKTATTVQQVSVAQPRTAAPKPTPAPQEQAPVTKRNASLPPVAEKTSQPESEPRPQPAPTPQPQPAPEVSPKPAPPPPAITPAAKPAPTVPPVSKPQPAPVKQPAPTPMPPPAPTPRPLPAPQPAPAARPAAPTPATPTPPTKQPSPMAARVPTPQPHSLNPSSQSPDAVVGLATIVETMTSNLIQLSQLLRDSTRAPLLTATQRGQLLRHMQAYLDALKKLTESERKP